jgi:hypothetical protein
MHVRSCITMHANATGTMLVIFPELQWLVPREITVRMESHPSKRGQKHCQCQKCYHQTGV